MAMKKNNKILNPAGCRRLKIRRGGANLGFSGWRGKLYWMLNVLMVAGQFHFFYHLLCRFWFGAGVVLSFSLIYWTYALLKKMTFHSNESYKDLNLKNW